MEIGLNYGVQFAKQSLCFFFTFEKTQNLSKASRILIRIYEQPLNSFYTKSSHALHSVQILLHTTDPHETQFDFCWHSCIAF
jgi:hypothetical protein